MAQFSSALHRSLYVQSLCLALGEKLCRDIFANHIDAVAQWADDHWDDNSGMRSVVLACAAFFGRTDMLDMLLQDPRFSLCVSVHELHVGLLGGVEGNHLCCVQQLLAYGADCRRHSSLALQHSARNKCEAVFDVLYPLSEPMHALREMKNKGWDADSWQILEQRCRMDALRDVLHAEVGLDDARSSETKRI